MLSEIPFYPLSLELQNKIETYNFQGYLQN